MWKYAILATVCGLLGTVILVTGIIMADDGNDQVLTGTELSGEDWQGCLDWWNAHGGLPKDLATPVLGADGQWHFDAENGGAFYSCGFFEQ